MATFRLKRKNFGIAQGIGNVVGGMTEGAGKVMDSGIGKVGGAVAGAALAPGLISSSLGLLPAIMAGPAAPVAGALLGWGAMSAAGKGLKAVGESLQS